MGFRWLTGALASALIMSAAPGMAAAQSEPGAETISAAERWKDLNADVVSAYRAGDYGKGVDIAEAALALAEEAFGQDHPDTLQSVNNLGFLYQSQGRYGEAEPLYTRALEARERTLGPDHLDTLISVNSLGDLYHTQGRYGEAEPLYTRALEARERTLGPDHPDTLTSVNNLGLLYQSQGRYGEVEPLWTRALEARTRTLGPDHPDTLQSVNNLGGLYLAQGRYGEAEPLFTRALEAIEHTLGPDHLFTLISVNNLGFLYQSQGRYGEAEPLYTRALEARTRTLGPDHPDTVSSVGNLGGLYQSQGRYGEAEPLLTRALEAFERTLGPDHPNTLISVNNLGLLYKSHGRHGEAEPLYLRTLLVGARKLGADHVNMAAYHGNYAWLLSLGSGARETAIYHLKQAVNVLQGVRSNMSALEDTAQAAFLDKNSIFYETLQEWLIEAGRFAEAEQVGRMLKEEEYFEFIRRAGEDDPRQTRIAFTPLEQDISARLEALAARPNQIAVELAAFEPLRLGDGTFAPDVQPRYDALLQRSDEAYQAYYVAVSAFQAGLAEETDQARAEAEALEADYYERFQSEVAALGSDVALVQITAFEDATHFFVITPDAFVHEEIGIGRAELFKTIAAARDLIDRPEGRSRRVADADRKAATRAALDTSLSRLDELLVAPFAHHLEDAGTRTLMLNLQGAIRYAPFAAFHDGETYLTERYQLALFNPVVRPDAGPRGNLAGASAFGVSQAHGSFSALPGVKDELERLFPGEDEIGILDGEFRLDGQFTRASLEAALASRPPVLHIASHFAMQPGDDTNSFLLLGDGDQLRLSDIAGSRRLSFDGVELMTLSACSTAMASGGTGVEVEGLGVLAQKRNAKAVLATLWNVADDGTAAFMAEFYDAMVADGMTKAEAMQAAQASMISSGNEDTERDYSHPYYWAPYVLMGSWR